VKKGFERGGGRKISTGGSKKTIHEEVQAGTRQGTQKFRKRGTPWGGLVVGLHRVLKGEKSQLSTM